MTGSAPAAPPLVLVLLATLDGMRWLPEQLRSILDQEGVQVQVVVSDDMSTDGTWEWLQEQAVAEPRVRLLPRVGPSGSAARNFYRLLRDVDPPRDALIAFADQDDVWHQGKLAAHAALVARGTADGVSSNVTACWSDGSRSLLRKDYPQRDWDFLFEGPGPGCTFVLSPRLAAAVRRVLRDPSGEASRLSFHDWLVYAVCRAAGWPWHIDSTPTVDYLQHDANTLGANLGTRSALHRLRLISQSWHRREATALARVSLEVAPRDRRAAVSEMVALLSDTGWRSRLRLAARAGHLRRRPRDRALLGLLLLGGVW